VEKFKFEKYAAYGFLALTAGNVIVDLAKPNYLPSDVLNNSIIVHGVSGSVSSVTSTINIMVSWPYIQQMEANRHIDRYGKSNYLIPSNQDNLTRTLL